LDLLKETFAEMECVEVGGSIGVLHSVLSAADYVPRSRVRKKQQGAMGKKVE